MTQYQWQKVTNENPSYFNYKGENYPVDNITWDDIQNFIQLLNKIDNKLYRLPTAIEWEYAAQAKTNTIFSYGNCLSTSQANYNGKYPFDECEEGKNVESPLPVGILDSNPWGLFDMYGNVREWCLDKYNSPDKSKAVIHDEGSYSPVIGGSWIDSANDCRPDNFKLYKQDNTENNIGFRLVIETTLKKKTPPSSPPVDEKKDIDTTPPSVPTGLRYEFKDKDLLVIWNNNQENDISHYNVYHGESSGRYKSPVLCKDNKLLIDDIDIRKINYISVSAVDSSGNKSGYSEELKQIPKIEETNCSKLKPPTGFDLRATD